MNVSPPGWREWRFPAFLFLTTLLSTMFAGLFYVYGDNTGIMRMAWAVFVHPSLLLEGIPFSFTLIAILLAHEMGHFLACRHYGIRCTPPFFLPFPVSYAGTLGAFIRIRSHFQHKRALFDVGIAGPLAGFAFVVPALIVGIAFSKLIPKGSVHDGIGFGEPLLFRLVGKAVLGYAPETQDMLADPIAMAAWFGLLATSLNLFPIWQLDGGHITYALFGRERQKKVSIGASIALMLVSFAGWPIPSYLIFACLIFFFGMRFRFYHPPTLYEEEGIGTAREILGIMALFILILSFTPIPIYLS
ncbi:MAG: site-2 protease family protein [Acidobacteriia bacterium]|nr:site-2 protease family protein [Terriglobia bacterium]